ncbi:hypothetical protein FSST1_012705 [Fusarium sambucinum]
MDCNLTRLHELVRNSQVEFDADIAGLGVLIAFVATSVTVIIVLALAFLTLSIPPSLLNAGDDVIASGIRCFYHRLRGVSSKLNQAEAVDNRNERIAAYKAFLHSTNDQLLISQIAIMVAALITHGEITIYSCNIVIALGCLASTVHLGCFPFYMDRLNDNRAAKFIRVLAMVWGFGILIFMFIIRSSLSWSLESHVYLKCAIQDFRLDGSALFARIYGIIIPITVFYGAWKVVILSYRQQSRHIQTARGSSSRQQHTSLPARVSHERHVMTHDDAETQLIERVPSRLQQYRNGNPSLILSQIEREILSVYGTLKINFTNDAVCLGDTENDDGQPTLTLLKQSAKPMSVKETWHRTRARERNALLNRWLQKKALELLLCEPKPGFRLNLRIGLLAEQWTFHQCRGSFVWRLCWLWSGVVYGTSSIFFYRLNTLGMSGDPDHWGFGQVVPLALLVLPLFAAMEGHADYKRQTNSKTVSYDETPTESTEGISFRPHSSRHSTSQERCQGARSANDVQAILFARELLKRRATTLRHPHLYNWVMGVSLDRSPSLQIGAICHAIFMLIFTTFWGLFIGWEGYKIILIFVPLWVTMTVRRVLGLIFKVKATRCLPAFLEKLGSDISNEPLHVRD